MRGRSGVGPRDCRDRIDIQGNGYVPGTREKDEGSTGGGEVELTDTIYIDRGTHNPDGNFNSRFEHRGIAHRGMQALTNTLEIG